jgi:hypothetical protein
VHQHGEALGPFEKTAHEKRREAKTKKSVNSEKDHNLGKDVKNLPKNSEIGNGIAGLQKKQPER